MGKSETVIALWPRPDGTAARWNAARLRIQLQLVYGRASERRRARILALVADRAP